MKVSFMSCANIQPQLTESAAFGSFIDQPCDYYICNLYYYSFAAWTLIFAQSNYTLVHILLSGVTERLFNFTMNLEFLNAKK